MSDAAEQPRETARSPTGFPGTRWFPKAKTAAAIAVVCSPNAGRLSAWLVSDLGLRNVHALGDQGEWEPALGCSAARGTWGTAGQCRRWGTVPARREPRAGGEIPPRLPLKAAIPPISKMGSWLPPRPPHRAPVHRGHAAKTVRPRALHLSKNRYSPPASARLSQRVSYRPAICWGQKVQRPRTAASCPGPRRPRPPKRKGSGGRCVQEEWKRTQ